MEDVFVRQRSVGELGVLAYLAAGKRSGQAVIIDPGDDPGPILGLVRESGVKVRYVLNTHGHPDHVSANQAVCRALGAPSCMHAADNAFFPTPRGKELALHVMGMKPPGPSDRSLHDGDMLQVGDFQVRVLHTPGHSPGSCCFLIDGHLFTGDTLFVGDVGRTDLWGASLNTLLFSIKEKLLPLADDTKVWPGHDYGERPSSTIGREKRENLYLTDFILQGRP